MTPGLYLATRSGIKLFTLGKSSWWRPELSVKDIQGNVVFRLKYHKGVSHLGKIQKWQIQVPDGTGYRLIGSSDSSSSRSWTTGIDLSVENLAGDGRLVNIHIHQPRIDLDQYHVTVNGILVARATRFKVGPHSRFSSWQMEIAKGFDLALVSCILLRIKTNKDWYHTNIMLTL